MVLKTGDIVPDLGFDLCQKVTICRVERAGKHRILPDKNAKLVTDVVERIAFIPAATPDPEHVHVGVYNGLQKITQGLGACLPGERILRNPVRAHRKYRTVIDPHHETASNLVGRGDKLHLAQANAFRDDLPVKLDHQVMQCLGPLMDRPPQVGCGDLECEDHGSVLMQAGGCLAAQAGCCSFRRTSVDLLRDGNANAVCAVELVDQ